MLEHCRKCDQKLRQYEEILLEFFLCFHMQFLFLSPVAEKLFRKKTCLVDLLLKVKRLFIKLAFPITGTIKG